MIPSLRFLVTTVCLSTVPLACRAEVNAAPFAFSNPGAETSTSLVKTSPTLRGFGRGEDVLKLTGERVVRDLPFFVTAAETARPARLVIAYTSAVSVMSETSRLQVFVNGIPLGAKAIAGGASDALSLALPTGLLQPGYNAVRIVADQHHRVDCSLSGTYELWTQIDPARSGFDFGSAQVVPSDLSELPSLFRNISARAAINILLPASAPSTNVEKALLVTQAVARLGRIENIDASISASPGKGPGLDIVIAPDFVTPGLLTIGSTAIEGVSLSRSSEDGRYAMTFAKSATGNVEKSIDRFVKAISDLQPSGTPTGLAALDAAKPLLPGETEPLESLGLDTSEFAGRFYRSALRFELPSDFYSADYDFARITLDAAFAGGLDPDATLIGLANGRQVFTLPLSAPMAGQIKRQDLKVPLSALRPGQNEVTFLATITKPSDAVCDPTTIGDLEPRFLLSKTSTISMPNMARVGHLPEIASLTSGGTNKDPLAIYAPGPGMAGLASAANFMAKVAATTGRIRPVTIISSVPKEDSGDVLALGTYTSLPKSLFDRVGIVPPGARNSLLGGTLASPIGADPVSNTAVPMRKADNLAAETRFAAFADVFSQSPDIPVRLREIVTNIVRSLPPAVRNLLPLQIDGGGGNAEQVPEDSRLLLAQAATSNVHPASLTVVAAVDDNSLTSGIEALSGTSSWNAVGGAISVMAQDGAVYDHPAPVERLFETRPRTFTNLRLILAGWLSRHFEIYVAMLLGFALLLGLTTRSFLRQVGAGR